MQSKTNENQVEVKVKIIPDYERANEQNRVFANYLSISHDAFTFTFTFCDTHYESIKAENLKNKDEDGKFELKIPIKAQIVIPPALMPLIIKACQENYESFNKVLQEQEKK